MRSLFLIFCILISNCLRAESLVRSEGMALITSTLDKSIYRTRAIENALQNLASHGVQTLDSFSIVENGQVLLDQVHLASKLGVQQYSVVREEIKGNVYHVALNVVVNDVQNKVPNNICLKAVPPSLDFSIDLQKKFTNMPAWVEYSNDLIIKAISARQFEPELQIPTLQKQKLNRSNELYSLYEKDNTNRAPDNLYKLFAKVVLEPSHNVNLFEKNIGLQVTVLSHVMRKDQKILEQKTKEHFIIQQKNLNGLFSPVTRKNWPLTKNKVSNFILEALEKQLDQLSCLKLFPKIVAKSGDIFLDFGSFDGIEPTDMFALRNSDAKKIYFKLESLEEHQTKIKIVSQVESLESLVGSEVEVVSGS